MESRSEGGGLTLDRLKLEEGTGPATNGTYNQGPTPADSQTSQAKDAAPVKPENESPVKNESASQTPKSEPEDTISGEITVTVEPGKVPKLSRKQSQKVPSRPAPLFDHLPDATEDATSEFQVIKDCIYGSKYMGHSEVDSLDCDCSESWRK